MVGHVKTWFLRALSTVVLLGSTGLILTVAAGGFGHSDDRPVDVSTADTLRHLLAGEGAPPIPVTDGDLQGTWRIVPAPTATELQTNLEKSLARMHLPPRNPPLASLERN